jgi:uncharacterized membrane protein YfcA
MVDFSSAAHLLPLVAAGFTVGLLVGLTGVGGGALMTPLLISSFGVPAQVAVGTDLLYASITKTAGGWRHHVADHVDWPVVLRLAAGSLPAAAVLLLIMAYLPVDTVSLAHWIRMGLVVALPISGLAIVLYPWFTQTSPGNDLGDVPPRTLPTVLFGVVLGLLVTLTSVGAGAIGVTVLAALYPVLPAKRLVGTDIARRARPSRSRQCRYRPVAGAAVRLDPRHSAWRAAGGDRPGQAAQTHSCDHAVLRGLDLVQQGLAPSGSHATSPPLSFSRNPPHSLCVFA